MIQKLRTVLLYIKRGKSQLFSQFNINIIINHLICAISSVVRRKERSYPAVRRTGHNRSLTACGSIDSSQDSAPESYFPGGGALE